MLNPSANPKIVAGLQTLARFSATFVIAIAVMALCGWLFNVEIFKTILPGLPSMKFNTALSFGLAGSALVCRSFYKRLTQLLGFIVFLIGALTLSQYLCGCSVGIDELLVRDDGGSLFPGRMASSTSLGVMFLGAGLLSLGIHRNKILSQLFALAIIALSAIVLVGYIYDVEELFRAFWFSTVALPTALGFLLLGLAILFTYPAEGLLRILTYHTRIDAGLRVRK